MLLYIVYIPYGSICLSMHDFICIGNSENMALETTTHDKPIIIIKKKYILKIILKMYFFLFERIMINYNINGLKNCINFFIIKTTVMYKLIFEKVYILTHRLLQ